MVRVHTNRSLEQQLLRRANAGDAPIINQNSSVFDHYPTVVDGYYSATSYENCVQSFVQPFR